MSQQAEPHNILRAEVDTAALAREYYGGKIDLICVLGPTASGKTRFAVELARELAGLPEAVEEALSPTSGNPTVATAGFDSGNGSDVPTGFGSGENLPCRHRQVEILSADSRQVYRGMTIGTGKDLEEYGDIPYHLIDIVPAGTKYNIFEYQRDFEKAYSDIRSRGALPILCGGSGLYIEAATRGYSLPEVPADPALRAELEKEDTRILIARLESLKTLHNSTDYDTRKRLIRALEIAIYEQSHPVARTDSLPKNTYYIGIDVSREERIRRIDRRLDTRLRDGLVEEVRTLMDAGIAPEDLIYYGLEYKYVTLYLTGKLGYGAMREKLATEIHRFAKRQMTWFRGMERRGVKIHWTSYCN